MKKPGQKPGFFVFRAGGKDEEAWNDQVTGVVGAGAAVAVLFHARYAVFGNIQFLRHPEYPR